MFTIQVEFLTGRYVATAHDDRRRAEWPPHPARLFSALVAAHYEAEAAENEKAALRWLEAQPAPGLRVEVAAGRRTVHDVFVPVNDVTTTGDLEQPLRQSLVMLERARASGAVASEVKKAEKDVEKRRVQLVAAIAALAEPEPSPADTSVEMARALLPDRRTRQVRTFPVVIPDDPSVAFIWAVDPPDDVKRALAGLCERVTRLGHSSSLVWCAVTDVPMAPDLVPRADGSLVLRTVGRGQLERLDAAFAEHQGVRGRVLPAIPQRYGTAAPAKRASPPSSVFGADWIVFERVGGARVLGSKAMNLARALRAALLEEHGRPGMPPALSGHEADGSPTKRPHLAFVALPFVGREHADGSVKGVAIVPPRDLSDSDREVLFRLIASWEARQAEGLLALAGEGLPPVQFRRVEIASADSARPTRWSTASTRFVTATPIALDRNPGNLRSNRDGTAFKAAQHARETISLACESIGLPRPSEVEISFAPLVEGAQASTTYLANRAGKAQRVRVHAELCFDQLVQGPVLLGAFRHFGLGLCLPVGGAS